MGGQEAGLATTAVGSQGGSTGIGPGEYNAYLDGKLMRFTDGAHFVWNGAYRLADAVLPVVAADWGIELES